MSLYLRLLIIVIGFSFSFFIIYLLVKKKINENISIYWLFGSVLIFAFSVFPELLDNIAKFIGVDYPPALMFLIATVILFIISMYQSVHISSLENRLKELTQQFAIEKLKNNESTKDIIDQNEL